MSGHHANGNVTGKRPRWFVAASAVAGILMGVSVYGVSVLVFAPPSLPPPRTVVYCRPSGVELLMDLYEPPRPSTAAVLYFHGGAWSSGDRTAGTWFRLIASELVARGITVGSADYRLAPQWQWPAQRHDASCALDYLRGRSFKELGVMGESAGGHLAAVLANEQALAGAVDLWGPTELSAIADGYADAFPDEAAVDDASPARRPTGRTPIFTVTGSEDELIPPEATLALAEALNAMGIASDRLVVGGAGHSMEGVSRATIVDPVVDFLTSRLGR